MRAMPITLILCLALAGTAGATASAGENPPQPVRLPAATDMSTSPAATAAPTLHAVYRAALALDPFSGIAGAYRLEAQALEARADGLFAAAPTLSLRQQSDRTGTDRGLREWEANVEVALWRPGERSASRDEATSMDLLATAREQALQLEVAGRVRDVLWELALSEEQRSLARQSWRDAQALEKDVQRRVEAGDLAKADLLLAQDETLSKHDEYLLAADAVRAAEKRYVSICGLPERPRGFSETQSPRGGIDPDHPLLLVAQRRVESARAELRRLRAAGSDSPLLTVGSRREREPVTRIEHDSLGVTLRVPFGGARYAGPAIAAANSQLVEAQAEQSALWRRLQMELHDAQRSLSTLQMELELAGQQDTMARESLRMARIAFDTGEIDLVQRLRVQARAYATERNLNLRRLQLQQATARYNQTVGELP